jgi:hypothetical protein
VILSSGSGDHPQSVREGHPCSEIERSSDVMPREGGRGLFDEGRGSAMLSLEVNSFTMRDSACGVLLTLLVEVLCASRWLVSFLVSHPTCTASSILISTGKRRRYSSLYAKKSIPSRGAIER